MKTVKIGSGAGYSGDRIEPAVELAERGGIDYLVFECRAQRGQIALAQQARMRDPATGYDPLLEARLRAVLPICARKRIRLVSNMGAANPRAAAAKTVEVARRLKVAGLKVAAVTGDDVIDAVARGDFTVSETSQPVRALGDRLISANAYLGAAPTWRRSRPAPTSC